MGNAATENSGTAETRVQNPQTPAVDPGKAAGSRGLLWAVVVGVVVLVVVILYGIYSRANAERVLAKQTQAAAIPSVSVTYPTLGSASQEIVLPGNAQAFIEAPIYARTNGYLKHWYADIGAHVHQGQLLATIETPELDQQLQQAQADLKTAQASLALADITNTRWQKMLAKHAVSVQESDQAQGDFTAKQAVVASSEANVRRLQQLQSYEKVTAPFDGVITARNTDIGALIDAGSSGTPKELFHLASIQKLRVFISVPELYAAAAENGTRVVLTQDSSPDPIMGTIVRNANAVDETTRTVNVEADVDNAGGHLLPGAYLFVHIKTSGTSHSVTIPSNTLLFRSEGLRVGVVRDGHVQLVPITIGHDLGSTVEVTSGLTTNDAIILDPSDSLATGAKVEVKLATQKDSEHTGAGQ